MASHFSRFAVLLLLLGSVSPFSVRFSGSSRRQRDSAWRRSLHIDPYLIAEQSKTWQGDIAGLLGGSIGVIGTLVYYEKRRFKMLERVLCPYCQGSGFLTCAVCHGAESLQVRPGAEGAQDGSGGAAEDEILCPNCDGAGAVMCPNCKGEGLSMPGQLLRQTLDIEMDDLEELMSQASVAAIQADHDRELAKKKKRLLLHRKARSDKGSAKSTGALEE